MSLRGGLATGKEEREERREEQWGMVGAGRFERPTSCSQGRKNACPTVSNGIRLEQKNYKKFIALVQYFGIIRPAE